MVTSPLKTISLLSLLVKLNYLEGLTWLLQRVCCNFQQLFGSFFLVEYIDSVEVHYHSLEGLVEYAMRHNNLKLIKVIYDDPHISSQFVRQTTIFNMAEVIIEYIIYDYKDLLGDPITQAIEYLMESQTTKFAF